MSKDEQTQKKQIATEVAIQEVTNFLKKHKAKDFRRNKMTEDKIKEDYIDVIEAVEDGLLVFEKTKPVYTLRSPLFEDAENKENIVRTVNFRARIKEADRIRVMDGLDVQKQQGTYTLKLIGYITQLKGVEIDRLQKEDFDVLNQICSVF